MADVEFGIVCPCDGRCHTGERSPCSITCVGHHTRFMELKAAPPAYPIALTFLFRCSGTRHPAGQGIVSVESALGPSWDCPPPVVPPPNDWFVVRHQGVARLFCPACVEDLLAWVGGEPTRKLTAGEAHP